MKLAGILLIFFAFSMLAFNSSRKEKNKINQLQEILDLMKYIRNQIEFFSRPIPDIYESYTPKYRETEELINDILREDWTFALKNCDCISCTNEINQILNQFGANLGKSNKQQQILHCDYCIEMFEKELNIHKTKSPNKIKTTVALWLYAGLMLIILFL